MTTARGRGLLLAGLGAVALSGYAFIAVVGHVFGPARAAPLSVLWTVANVLGAGLFVPVEQELARRGASRHATGRPVAPLARAFAATTLLLVLLLAAGTLATARPVADALFSGRVALVGCLLLLSAGFAAQHVIRGLLAARGRFDAYGVQLLVDAALRVAGPLLLLAFGVRSLTAYGVALAAAPAASVLLTCRGARAAPDRAPDPASGGGSSGGDDAEPGFAAALGLVITAQVLSTAVIGAGPVAATMLAGPGETAAAGVLIGVLLVSRVPLLGFYAVQATMLPALARLVAVGDLAEVRRRLGRALGLIAVAGAACALPALVAGPAVVRLTLGPGFDPSAGLVAALVAAVFVYIAAAVAAQALLALDGHVWSALAWAGGCAAYAALLLRPDDLTWRVTSAFLGSGAVALLLAAVPLAVAVRSTPTARRAADRIDDLTVTEVAHG